MNHSSTPDTLSRADGWRIEPRSFRRALLRWYDSHKRDLPWRGSRDPFRVWVSEIMLQQTRAAAVIPYYERFLARFPKVDALAAAPEHDVLAAWAGLGYYSRARNLQRAAREISALGSFPRDYASIRNLPGIGDYTAAAVASIAFDLPYAVLDGNVIRVLSRLTAEPGNVRQSKARSRLRTVAEHLLDPKRPGDFNQAMMELGATVCLPKRPQCRTCPVVHACVAFALGKQAEFPILPTRAASSRVERRLLLIERGHEVLVWQRLSDSRRLAGFWELPGPDELPEAAIGERIGGFRHTIVNTTYQIDVHRASISEAPRGFCWLSRAKLDEVPLSTTARKALSYLLRNRIESAHA